MTDLYVVTGNHRSFTGILDHMTLIGELFGKKYNCKVTQFPVEGEHNIIIEEFTNRKFCLDAKSKNPPKQNIIY